MSIDLKPKKTYIHTVTLPEAFKGGKWTYRTIDREVILMITSGNYAMVRVKGCAPFVVASKELKEVTK